MGNMKPVTLLQGLTFPDFGLGRFFTSEKPGGLISHSWAEFQCEILPPSFEARHVEHTFQSFTSKLTEATRRHPKEEQQLLRAPVGPVARREPQPGITRRRDRATEYDNT